MALPVNEPLNLPKERYDSAREELAASCVVEGNPYAFARFISSPIWESSPPRDELKPSRFVIDVTPELAHILLERNTHNRRGRKRWVEDFARQMDIGRWRHIETLPLSFDRNGVLDNGQHRLEAVTRSGTTQRFTVWINTDPRDREVIDGQHARNLEDVLGFAGNERNLRHLGTATRFVFLWENGLLYLQNPNPIPSNEELANDVLYRNPDLTRSLGIAASNLVPHLSPGTVAGFHYVFSLHDLEKADEFVYLLSSGEGLMRGDPIYTLRERLIQLKGQRRPPAETRAMIIKAWNHYRQGTQWRVARWSTSESFPTIR